MGRDKTKILSGSATLIVDGQDIGYTRDGLTLGKGIDTRNIEADQEQSPLYIKLTGRSLEISTNVLQVTLENMKITMGESAPVVSNNCLVLGRMVENLPEFSLVFYGKRQDGKYIKFEIPKAIVSASGDSAFVKDGEFLLPVTFTAVYDSSIDGLAIVREVENV